MKRKVLLCSLIILFACFGFSQETGKVGFLFKSGSISSVGLSFNISKCLTLRPSFGFNTVKVDQDPPDYQIGRSPKSTSYNGSLGLFYHFLQKDHLSAYSGLEFGYLFQKLDQYLFSSSYTEIFTEKRHGFTGSVILGLQYNLNKHLAVFGEIGLGYQRTKYVEEMSGYNDTTKYTSWDLNRSGFGIILYL